MKSKKLLRVTLCALLVVWLLAAFLPVSANIARVHNPQTFDTYEEFTAAIDTKKLQRFVPATQLAGLGSVKSVKYSGDYNQPYVYYMTDSAETDFSFSIGGPPTESAFTDAIGTSLTVSKNNSADLRYLITNEAADGNLYHYGFLYGNSICYAYFHIPEMLPPHYEESWHLSYIYVRMSSDPADPNYTVCYKIGGNLVSYPQGKDTLVGRLLNAETVDAAAAELRQMAAYQPKQEPEPTPPAEEPDDLLDSEFAILGMVLVVGTMVAVKIGIAVIALILLIVLIVILAAIVKRCRKKKRAAVGNTAPEENAGSPTDAPPEG